MRLSTEAVLCVVVLLTAVIATVLCYVLPSHAGQPCSEDGRDSSNLGFVWDTNRSSAWRCLACFAACCATSALAQNTFTIFLIPMARKTGHTVSATATVYTVHNSCIGLFAMPATRLAKKRGMRAVLSLGLLLVVVAFTVLSYATHLVTFIMCYVLLGFCVGTMFVPCVAATIDLMPPSLQGTAAGIVTMFFPGGSVPLMTPISRAIRHWGMSNVYRAVGLGSVGIIGLSLAALPREGDVVTLELPEDDPSAETEADSSPNALSGKEEARTPEASILNSKELARKTLTRLEGAVLFLVYLLGMCTYNLIESCMEPILDDTLDDNTADMGVTVGLLTHTLGYAVWGLATAGLSAGRCLGACGLLLSASLLAWSFTAGPALPPGGKGWQLVPSSVAAFCTPGHIALMPMLVQRLTTPQEAARILSIIVLSEAAAFTAPLVTRLAEDIGWPVTLKYYAAVPLLMCAVVLAAAPRDEAPADGPAAKALTGGN